MIKEDKQPTGNVDKFAEAMRDAALQYAATSKVNPEQAEARKNDLVQMLAACIRP